MSQCPDCRNEFVQPFVCTSCGAEKLYDATVRGQAMQIERLHKLLAECYAELTSNLSQIMNDYENIPPDGEGMAEAKMWIDRLTALLSRIDAAVQR